MPVYDNLDYPALKDMLKLLEYIQSRNGSIVIHDPLVQFDEAERESLDVRMGDFIQPYKMQIFSGWICPILL